MSLISEALRKARQEAARQEALKSGSAYPFLVEPAPDRGKTRTYLILGLLAVLLAAGLGAAGAVWLMSDKLAVERTRGAEVVAEAPPAEPVTVIEETPGSLPAAPEVPQADVPKPEPAPAPETAAPEPSPAQISSEPPARPVAPPPATPPVVAPPSDPRLTERPIQLREPAPAADSPVSDPVLPTPVPAAPAPAAPAPAPETSQPSGATEAAVAAGLEDGKTFVREVPLPGGGALRLNGIAFSENPVALFSDKVVAPGEEVQGFKVSKVEAGRVELQGHGVTVYVTVK